jgi:hypothetical protein
VKFSRDPEPNAAEAAPRRRWRFWLLFLGLPLAIGGLAVVGYVVSSHSGLSAAVAEADQLDPGWRLAEIEAKRAVIPEAENGAAVIAWLKATPINGTPDNNAAQLLNDLDPPRLLNDQQRDALKKFLDTYAPRLPIARSLRNTPRGRHPITWSANSFATLLPCQDNREAAHVLRHDVLDRCQAGDLDAAAASCVACLHAGSSLGDEPTAISMLVRIACEMVAVQLIERTLAQGEASPALLAELQARMEAEEPAQLLLIAARGERALSNHFFDNLRAGNLGPNAVTGVVAGGAPGGGFGVNSLLDGLAMLPGFVAAQQTGCLRYANRIVEVAKLPPEQWAAPFAQMRQEAPNLPVLARLLAPAMDKIADACRRHHAMLRCAIAALAMERYRKEKGRWAESLAELVAAGYLKAVPTDPTDGKPLRLKRTADGWLVYAIGVDGTDHGGTLDRQKMYRAGNDFAVQLWDVAARRQPPPPPKPSEDGESPAAPAEPPPPAPPADGPKPPPAAPEKP